MPARKAARTDGSDTPTPPATSRPRRTRAAAESAVPAADVAAKNGSGRDSGAAEPADAGAAVRGNVLDGPAIHEDGSWVEADAVEIHQGAVGRAEATDIRVSQGAIGAARADRIDIQMGGLGAAMSSEINISQGGAGSILAQRASVEQSFVRTLVAQEVEIRRPSAILVLIAQRVTGDVRVLLDWRGALAFGAAFGLVAGLVRRARGRR